MAAPSQEDLGGARHTIEAVNKMTALLRQMLQRAISVKDSTDIEPALSDADFGDFLQKIESLQDKDPRRLRQFPIVETAVRHVFDELLVSHRSCNPPIHQV